MSHSLLPVNQCEVLNLWEVRGKGENRFAEEELEKDGIKDNKCGCRRRIVSIKFMKVIKLKKKSLKLNK